MKNIFTVIIVISIAVVIIINYDYIHISKYFLILSLEGNNFQDGSAKD